MSSLWACCIAALAVFTANGCRSRDHGQSVDAPSHEVSTRPIDEPTRMLKKLFHAIDSGDEQTVRELTDSILDLHVRWFQHLHDTESTHEAVWSTTTVVQLIERMEQSHSPLKHFAKERSWIGNEPCMSLEKSPLKKASLILPELREVWPTELKSKWAIAKQKLRTVESWLIACGEKKLVLTWVGGEPNRRIVKLSRPPQQ